MSAIVINRWQCKNVEGAEIVAIMERNDWSRLVMVMEGFVTHLSTKMNIPPADDPESRGVQLRCLAYLCASGEAVAQHPRWVLPYIFEGFKP